jgi:hypothetical protein
MIYKAYFKHRGALTAISFKIISKIIQFRRFYLFSNKYFKNFENLITFSAISKIINQNFIYSGFNLTFLGLVINKVKVNKFYLWPDGMISMFLSLKKYPGSLLYTNLKLPKKIERIVILGNLDDLQKKRIIEKFKLPIKFIKVKKINISLFENKKIKLKDKEILFITLPSPYQEFIANKISEYTNNYKIICFGGALNILYNKEHFVPKYIRTLNIEFLYRLKTDTVRRTLRLFNSLIFSLFYVLVKSRFYVFKKNI